jgi:hypothetical protein
MSDIAHGKTEAPSPQSHLIQMATAHWVSRFLYVAARMNLADQLAERSKTAEELAQVTGATVSSMYRFMRTLASLGLFTEDSGHRFSLTRLGEALRTRTPGSVRASVLTLAAAEKNAVIRARRVGMRSHYKTSSPITKMAHGLLFSGRFAVEVEHDRIDVSPQPMHLQNSRDSTKRVVRRFHE